METYEIFKDLAIILISAKLCGLLAGKLHAPQVVGEIIAGLLIGPSILGLVQQNELISGMAEIGVVLLMFFAGLQTNLRDLMRTGWKALLIACAGVFVPLAGGYLLHSAYYGFAPGGSSQFYASVFIGVIMTATALLIACAGVFVPLAGGYLLHSAYYGFAPGGSSQFYASVFIGVIMTATSVSITVASLQELGYLKSLLHSAYYGFAPGGSSQFYASVFIGVIMTATSVSITVASLQELGYLKSETGTTIMSAAIIDDVIGIIVLTFVIGMKDPTSKPSSVIISTVLFFLCAVLFGVIIYKLFAILDKHYPHTRRIPIFGFVLAFAMAYIAEKYFGIADITGAYVAGIVLCSIDDSEYIARKVDVSSYMLFAPMFFASIGLKTDIEDMSSSVLIFCILFVIVALITKIVGCGLMSKILGFSTGDSLKIGVGMMTRGEVALIVAQKGLSVGMIESKYFTAVILLILVSSIVTPIVLKLLYRKHA